MQMMKAECWQGISHINHWSRKWKWEGFAQCLESTSTFESMLSLISISQTKQEIFHS